jgi:hypothetical protein
MNKALRLIYEKARSKANTILINGHRKEYKKIFNKVYSKMLKGLK